MSDQSSFLVFVYGTLKRGQRNHHYLEHAEFIYETTTESPNYLMQAFSSVTSPGKQTPGVFKMGTARISGEIYKVSGDTFSKLDELEQVGIKYDRVEASFSNGMKAFIYLEKQGNRKPLENSPHLTFTNNTFEWI